MKAWKYKEGLWDYKIGTQGAYLVYRPQVFDLKQYFQDYTFYEAAYTDKHFQRAITAAVISI